MSCDCNNNIGKLHTSGKMCGTALTKYFAHLVWDKDQGKWQNEINESLVTGLASITEIVNNYSDRIENIENNLYRDVAVSELDDYHLTASDYSKEGVYSVVYPIGDKNITIGTLLVSHDNMRHGTDQVLISNTNATSIATMEHTDGELYIYHRYYNLSSPYSSVKKGTWGKWTLIGGTTYVKETQDNIETLENKCQATYYGKGILGPNESPTIEGFYLKKDDEGNIVSFVSYLNGKVYTLPLEQGKMYVVDGYCYGYDGEKAVLTGAASGTTSWDKITGIPDNVTNVGNLTSVINDVYVDEKQNLIEFSKYKAKDGLFAGQLLYAYFKTINGQSLLGKGNISIKGEGSLQIGEEEGTAFEGNRGKALEELLTAEYKPVTQPTLYITNKFYKDNHYTDELKEIPSDWQIENEQTVTGTKTNIIEGCYFKVFLKYSWTSSAQYKDPTECSMYDDNFALTKSGEISDEWEVMGYSAASGAAYIKLSAPATGLMVDENGYVIKAQGNDVSKSQVNYLFYSRIYYGATDTPSDISSLTNKLFASKANTLTGVTTNKQQYFIYAYPYMLGELKVITQNGSAPVLTAFTQSTTTIKDFQGADSLYRVYTSNNPGAFTDVTLKFE